MREWNPAELPSLAERAARQTQTYWKIRSAKTLEKLEVEARKMLRLEEELGAFALQYYDAVGEHVLRLSELEIQLEQFDAAPEGIEVLPDVVAQRQLHASRRSELKARYRTLAKEIHPDRAAITHSAGSEARHMHRLNSSYQKGDLAGLLRLEAEIILNQASNVSEQSPQREQCLREIERASQTYAQGYRALLNSPLNELMLRAMSARLAGWNWLDAVVRRVTRAIEEKERALAIANIAAIGEWREAAVGA